MVSSYDIGGADGASVRSQASKAYFVVRDDIIAGRQKPGAKLKVQGLAADLGISAGAVREALSRLVPEQLVVSEDQRGFTVAPLSINDLEDLTDLRCVIEAEALHRSVALGDIDWEIEVISAGHRLRSLHQPAPGTASSTTSDWVSAHAKFHTALISACGSRRLIALHTSLYEQSERYRWMSARVDQARNVVDEHQKILDLALARDAEGLVAAMLGHLRETTRLTVQGAREQTEA